MKKILLAFTLSVLISACTNNAADITCSNVESAASTENQNIVEDIITGNSQNMETISSVTESHSVLSSSVKKDLSKTHNQKNFHARDNFMDIHFIKNGRYSDNFTAGSEGDILF